MTIYLWTISVLLLLSAITKLSWLAKGSLPSRSPFYEALDVVVNFGFVLWAAFILAE